MTEITSTIRTYIEHNASMNPYDKKLMENACIRIKGLEIDLESVLKRLFFNLDDRTWLENNYPAYSAWLREIE